MVTRRTPSRPRTGPRARSLARRRLARPLAGALLTIAALVGPGAARPVVAQMPAPGDTTRGTVLPGDRVVVKVYREPELGADAVVGADGEILLPKIGRLAIAGWAPEAVRDTVRARLARYLREAAVDVAVLRRIGVFGEVKLPNLYYVDVTVSLRDLLATAGGFGEAADTRYVTLVRDGERRRLRVDALAIAPRLPLRSGDQLVVARRPWLVRNGLTAFSSLAVAVSVLVTALRR